MTCIKMGSDESHFNVSLIIVRDKVRRQFHKPQLLKRKESRSCIEPRSFRLPAYRLTARPNGISLSTCQQATYKARVTTVATIVMMTQMMVLKSEPKHNNRKYR